MPEKPNTVHNNKEKEGYSSLGFKRFWFHFVKLHTYMGKGHLNTFVGLARSSQPQSKDKEMEENSKLLMCGSTWRTS